jgi:group I intron endonuclease
LFEDLKFNILLSITLNIREFSLFLIKIYDINMKKHNNNQKMVPIYSYPNADLFKAKILKDNKNKSGIYRWTNNINNKSYVGSSINLAGKLGICYSKKAMLNKLSTRTSIIYNATLKHDYVNFSLYILEYCDINVLIEKEQYYLDILKPEYNIIKIANSRLGSKQLEATKIKISISNKGKHQHFLGKRHTYESRQMMSLSFKSITRNNNIPRIIKLETRLKLFLRSQGEVLKVFNTSEKFVKEFPTITSAAKYFDVKNISLNRYIDKNKSYNGYTFKYNYKDK